MDNHLKATILTELLESSSDDDDDDEVFSFLFSSTSSSYSESETSEDNSREHDRDTKSMKKARLKSKHPSNVDSLTNFLDAYSDEDFRSHFKMQRSTAEFLATSYSSSVFTSSILHGGKPRIGPRREAYLYIFYITNTITFTSLATLFGVSKSSSWLAVGRVAKWLIRVGHNYVQWPTGNAFNENQQKFEADKQIPGVIGAIACSHIEIKGPKFKNKRLYKRGTSYCITLQAVADADKKFIDVYCGEPGSFNENKVLHESELLTRAQEKYTEMFPENSFILGGAVYLPNKWLVPLYKDHELTDSQRSFNLLLSEKGTVIEQAFALLKSRFRKLTDLKEQTNVPAITALVVSACVMHNICIVKNDIYSGEIIQETPSDYQPKEYLGDGSCSDGSRQKALFNYLLEKNII